MRPVASKRTIRPNVRPINPTATPCHREVPLYKAVGLLRCYTTRRPAGKQRFWGVGERPAESPKPSPNEQGGWCA
jgi:hypothetical protein